MKDTIDVLDHGYVKFIDRMGTEESIIEAARMSTDGNFVSWEPYEKHPKGDAGLLSYLYKNQHMSPFEMCELVVEVQAPLFVVREWQRHRTFSYNEFSGRYSKMPDLHYVPSYARLGVVQPTYIRVDIDSTQRDVFDEYEFMLSAGVPKELARINTPLSRYTRMRAKANLRNWLGFLNLRLRENAQWEIRQYAEAVKALVGRFWPRTLALFEEHTLYAKTLSRTEAAARGL